MTVVSLSASLLQKIGTATYHLCQIPLNKKRLHKFKKWCKFSSHIKSKMHKNKSHNIRLARTLFYTHAKTYIHKVY